MFPDPRKMREEAIAYEGKSSCIEEGSGLVHVAPPGHATDVPSTELVPAPRPDAQRNYWEQREHEWIYWKKFPTKGRVDVYADMRGKRGPMLDSLDGVRFMEATFNDNTSYSCQDTVNAVNRPEDLSAEESILYDRLSTETWIGSAEFPKKKAVSCLGGATSSGIH